MGTGSESRKELCGYRVERGLYAGLTCGLEKGHTGVHIDFRPNATIGFGEARGSVAPHVVRRSRPTPPTLTDRQ